MLLTKEVVSNYSNTGHKKAHTPLIKLFLLAIIGGSFIALAGAGANTAMSTVNNPSLSKLVSAVLFPGGLAMVMCATCELFTSDCLMSISVLTKKITFFEMIRTWIVVYIGNLVGSMTIAYMIFSSKQLSLFDNSLAYASMKIAVKKCSLNFTDALTLGILCNILVCIAAVIAYSSDTIIDKIAGLYFPILLFVVAGYEHCIANMFYIPVGLFAKNNPKYLEFAAEHSLDLTNLTYHNFFINNLLPVTIGNIIGGSLCIGALYWLIFLKDETNH